MWHVACGMWHVTENSNLGFKVCVIRVNSRIGVG